MKITFCPKVVDGSLKGHPATTACGDAVENFIQGGLARVGDQTTSKVFRQGLVRARRSLPQDSISLSRKVFDLHAGHGAIFAQVAPNTSASFRPCREPIHASKPRRYQQLIK